jgi:hypothetical protein
MYMYVGARPGTHSASGCELAVNTRPPSLSPRTVTPTARITLYGLHLAWFTDLHTVNACHRNSNAYHLSNSSL